MWQKQSNAAWTSVGGDNMKTALKIIGCIAVAAAMAFGVWKLVEVIKN